VFSAQEGCLGDARWTGSEKRALILWVICGVLGLCSARYFFRGFRKRRWDFKVSRTEAQQRRKTLCKAWAKT